MVFLLSLLISFSFHFMLDMDAFGLHMMQTFNALPYDKIHKITFQLIESNCTDQRAY